MTQEEKAKAYDEALGRAKKIYNDSLVNKEVRQEDMIYLFPELKESEDERIRNGLIALLKFGLEDGSAIAPGFNETKEQALAWLEKQGEQKHGISELTKQKLNTLLNEALQKETPESWNKFLGQSEQSTAWSEEDGMFARPLTPLRETAEVATRLPYVDDDLKPIAEFIMDYCLWDLRKDNWNKPVIVVPLFRVLDALIQRGKPYCEGE